MELISILRAHLGELPFLELIPDYLFRESRVYHLSFYRNAVDADLVPMSEHEHVDKKAKRLDDFVKSLENDLKDLKHFMAQHKELGGMENNLRLAKGIHGRFQKAQGIYAQRMGIQVADWKLLAKSKALKKEVLATFDVAGDRSVQARSTASMPTRPIAYGVEHIAIQVQPRQCDFHYCSSFQAMPKIGSGSAYEVNFVNGKFKKVRSHPTYIS